MQVHYSTDQLPSFKKAVVTIGTFDGVHLGHKKIIGQIVNDAKENQGESVLITFHPHPRSIVSSVVTGVRLINTLEEKLQVLKETGLNHVVVVPFTAYFANQTANEYITDFLVAKFKPKKIVIGYDHRFGKERSGNFALLQEKAALYGYELVEIAEQLLDQAKVSSTTIRNALVHSNIDEANKLLGYAYFFSGKVVHGNKIGRTIGYPTANLETEHDDKIQLGNGIYAVTVYLAEQTYKGMMSIGFRPTINGTNRVTEVNIFDFEGDLYGTILQVHVQHFLRSEVKFNGLAALQLQLDEDKKNSLTLLNQ